MNTKSSLLRERFIKEDLPYEKFMRIGAEGLSDSELLAIILRTGTRNFNVYDIAKSILSLPKIKQFGIPGISRLKKEELMAIPGMGPVKSAQVMCISELSKRMSVSFSEAKIPLDSARKIASMYMPKMRLLEKEVVMAVYLDTKLRFIKDEQVSVGSINSSIMEPREIIRSAMECNATNIFVLHNHPSGDPTPSMEDSIITNKLLKACNLVSVKLIDHIIVGDNKYYSYNEKGFL